MRLTALWVLASCVGASSKDSADTAPAAECPGVELLAAGWSYGECQGPCVGELNHVSGGVAYRISDWDGTEQFSTSGDLTAQGAAALCEAIAPLADAQIEETYGCPDCDDGGAEWARLSREAVTLHTWEAGAPPEELVALRSLTAALFEALSTCTSDGRVEVSSACVPF